MDAKTLLNADYLDIVFDQRNKKYGGYELRKHYDRRLLKACGSLLLIVVATASFSFITIKRELPPVVKPGIISVTKIDNTPKIIPPPKAKPAIPPAPRLVKTLVYTTPKIEDDNAVKDDKLLAKNDDIKDMHIGSVSSEGDTSDISIIPTKTPGNGPGLEIPVKPAEPKIFVDQMPEFQGDLNGYIAKNIRYPEMARAQNTEGRVVIRFVVNEDGSVTDATIIRSVGNGCDDETIRIVANMPKWKPGKQNGVPVKVYFTLPVKFELK